MSDLEIFRPRQLARWRRAVNMVRSITLGPWNPKDPAIARMFGGRQTSAGVPVNEHTAMTYSAIWNAVAIIAEQVAAVPLKLYKPLDGGRGKQPFVNHPLYRLLHDRPNPYMGSYVFRRHVQASKLLWGNGYAEIERDVSGRPIALWPLLPWAVQPFYDSAGAVKYRVANPNSTTVVFDAADVIHLRNVSTSGDGLYGDPPIPAARESFGLALAAERFGATFFGNGSTFGGIISYPAGVGGNIQTRKENREALEKAHMGPDRAHRFLALYEGAAYKEIGIPPNAAQFLETRIFQIEEVCRWFNLPPHKLKQLQRTTNASIEQQSIEFVSDTLVPHWEDWEEELSAKLVPVLERQQQIIEHVREGLLRGDTNARGEFYSKMFSIGGMTLNEIRERENLSPVAGGDTVFVPLNSMPLNRLTEWVDATIEAKKPPKPAPPQEPPTHPVQAPALPPEQKKAWDDATAELRAAASVYEEQRDANRALLAKEEAAHAATMHILEAAKGEWTLTVARYTAAESDLRQQIAHVTSDYDSTITERDAARADIAATAQRIAALEAERDAAAAARDAAQTSVLESEARHAETCAALDASRALVAAGEAVRVDRDAALTARAELETRLALEIGRVRGMTSEAETLRTELAQARAEIASGLDRARAKRGVLLASMRALFVEASKRLLQKEIDRARKHQATAEKLRAWAEQFYPMHEQACRAAFQPIVGPWTTVAGGDPSALLTRLVTDHVAGSRMAWSLVAEQDDLDAMAAALERTVLYWEAERADRMADEMIREGMAS